MKRTVAVIQTKGRGFYSLDAKLYSFIQEHEFQDGMLHLFIKHTSASLIITENADENVRKDLESFMRKIAPDGDPSYLHQDEGEDDMPSHIRSVLTQTEMMIPVEHGKLLLGTWQSVFLWEHRFDSHQRKIILTFLD